METEEGRTKIIWMRRWVRGWRGAKRRSGTKGFYCAGGNNPQRLDHTVSFFTWNLTHNQLQLGCLEVKTPWDGVNSAELFLPANRSDGRPSQQTENKSEVKGREEGIIKQWQPEHTPGLEIWIDNPAWLSWTINYFRLFVTGRTKGGTRGTMAVLAGPGERHTETHRAQGKEGGLRKKHAVKFWKLIRHGRAHSSQNGSKSVDWKLFLEDPGVRTHTPAPAPLGESGDPISEGQCCDKKILDASRWNREKHIIRHIIRNHP